MKPNQTTQRDDNKHRCQRDTDIIFNSYSPDDVTRILTMVEAQIKKEPADVDFPP